MIICAGRNETFEFAKPMGVGLIESAINLTKQCLENKPEFIIFVGSAGSYGKHKIFDIIEAKKASNIELSFLSKDSYTPLDKILESKNEMLRDDTIVNSSNYISTNKELSKQYNELGITIENMEFFSLVQVANEFDIPIAGVFIVTNYTNENAHKDFLKNHKEAMNKLSEYLLEKNIINN
ncbi:MAG: purine-nucleoside phosphorylase [Poseidonibacter sp.]